MRLDEAARDLIGVPFLHQGRNPRIGIDCIGLLVCASKAAGTDHWRNDSTDYGRDPHHGLLEAHMVRIFGPPVAMGPRPANLLPGDVVCIDFVGATRHVGIVGAHAEGGLSLIHTSGSIKRVTEQRLDDRWAKRIREVHRPEIAL